MRAHIPTRGPVLTWLKALQANIVEILQYQYTGLDEIALDRLASDAALYDSVIVVESAYRDASLHRLSSTGLAEELLTVPYPDVPLRLAVVATTGQLSINLSCLPEYFDPKTMENMLAHYADMLVHLGRRLGPDLADIRGWRE